MLPLCPQRNSRKWGVDELSWEVVVPVVLKHREFMAVFWNGGQQTSEATKSWTASCLAVLQSHCHHLVVIPGTSGLDYSNESLATEEALITAFFLPFSDSDP